MGPSQLPRDVMRTVTNDTTKRLEDRLTAGPPEAALDAFIPDLKVVATNLGDHVAGKVTEDARRRASLVTLDEADDDVDTYARHHYRYLLTASQRRTGAWAASSKAILAAAFPDGLDHLDDYIPTENRLCRASITAIQTDDNAETLKAIELPPDWTTKWIAALDRSDAAWKDVQAAREAFTAHVDGGVDAEADFVELVGRLRKYIGSRAGKRNKARWSEGQALLAPLTEALEKAERERAARETRKKTAAKKKDATPATATPATPSTTDAPATPTTTPAGQPADPNVKPE